MLNCVLVRSSCVDLRLLICCCTVTFTQEVQFGTSCTVDLCYNKTKTSALISNC